MHDTVAPNSVRDQLKRAVNASMRDEIHFEPLTDNSTVVFTNVGQDDFPEKTEQALEEKLHNNSIQRFISTTEVCRNQCRDTEYRCFYSNWVMYSVLELTSHIFRNNDCILCFKMNKWNKNKTDFYSMMYCYCTSDDYHQLIGFCKGVEHKQFTHVHFHFQHNGNDAAEDVLQPNK